MRYFTLDILQLGKIIELLALKSLIFSRGSPPQIFFDKKMSQLGTSGGVHLPPLFFLFLEKKNQNNGDIKLGYLMG